MALPTDPPNPAGTQPTPGRAMTSGKFHGATGRREDRKDEDDEGEESDDAGEESGDDGEESGDSGGQEEEQEPAEDEVVAEEGSDKPPARKAQYHQAPDPCDRCIEAQRTCMRTPGAISKGDNVASYNEWRCASCTSSKKPCRVDGLLKGSGGRDRKKHEASPPQQAGGHQGPAVVPHSTNTARRPPKRALVVDQDQEGHADHENEEQPPPKRQKARVDEPTRQRPTAPAVPRQPSVANHVSTTTPAAAAQRAATTPVAVSGKHGSTTAKAVRNPTTVPHVELLKRSTSTFGPLSRQRTSMPKAIHTEPPAGKTRRQGLSPAAGSSTPGPSEPVPAPQRKPIETTQGTAGLTPAARPSTSGPAQTPNRLSSGPSALAQPRGEPLLLGDAIPQVREALRSYSLQPNNFPSLDGRPLTATVQTEPVRTNPVVLVTPTAPLVAPPMSSPAAVYTSNSTEVQGIYIPLSYFPRTRSEAMQFVIRSDSERIAALEQSTQAIIEMVSTNTRFLRHLSNQISALVTTAGAGTRDNQAGNGAA